MLLFFVLGGVIIFFGVVYCFQVVTFVRRLVCAILLLISGQVPARDNFMFECCAKVQCAKAVHKFVSVCCLQLRLLCREALLLIILF